jgi:transcriptional regulator with XRE-family HTH domain
MSGKTRVQLSIKKYNEEGEKLLEFIRKRIIKARTEAGMSQRKLSTMAMKSNNHINRIENGEIEPGFTDIIAIAYILDKPLKYFLPEKYIRDKDDQVRGGHEYDLVSYFRRITNEDIQRIGVKTVQDLAELKN